MKQFYAKYTEWEDYKNGMYTTELQNKLIIHIKNLLCDEDMFLNTAIEMVKNWEISAKVNLTNKSCNRIAWVGQASCCYKLGANELTVKKAWSEIPEDLKTKANNIANKIVKSYEAKNSKLHKNMGEQMLF